MAVLLMVTTSFQKEPSSGVETDTQLTHVRDFTLSYYRAPEHPSPPVNFLDLYDSFQKDDNGDLIITPTGSDVSSDFTGSEYRRYVLFTKKGRPVSVAQETPTRRLRHKSNCHGLTFLHGDYWLPSAAVALVLKDNGWATLNNFGVRRGDVAVYRDSTGKIVHTAKVVGRDFKGRILVNSKNGFELEVRSVRAELVVP
jgi:hypothetical protein